MANKISLNIAGFNLIINTQEDEAQVRKLNDMLNSDLKQILNQNPSASVTNAALLCALDYLDRFDKATNNANNMRDQIKDYMADASNAKLQYDDEVRKNSELNEEVENLRNRITKLASEGAAGSAVEQSLRTELESVKNELATVKGQLKEQIEKNASILSDFGILNNALKNKDNEIANLNERVNQVSGELAEAKKQADELTASVSSLTSERDSLTNDLNSARQMIDTLDSHITELQNSASEEKTAPESSEPDHVVYDSNYGDPQRPDPAPFSFSSSPEFKEDSMTEVLEDEEEYTSDDAPADEPVAFYDDEREAVQPEAYADLSDEKADDETSAVADSADPFSDIPYPNNTDSAVKAAPKKDYRLFDYEDGAIEDEDGEVGVGDGFKTFGQMMAEERKQQSGNSYNDANSGKLDDDSLPNLSWINDID